MRRRLTHAARLAASLLLLASAARAQHVPAGGPLLAPYLSAAADNDAWAEAIAECVTVHDVWQWQLHAVQQTLPGSAERAGYLEEYVRLPYERFWNGYVGDRTTFARWLGERVQLEHDARRTLPLELDMRTLITETTKSVADYTGRLGCGEWFAAFGPGRTDMGSLGNGRMVIDFLGMSPAVRADDVRFTLAHEVNHLIFSERRELDPDAGTVLYRMIDEGLAAYVAQQHAGAHRSPARALSWSEAELTWALRNEKRLWSMLRRYLNARHGDVHDLFFLYDQRVLPEAPGKIGYFLGYRVIESYVRRYGAESWRSLYDLDAREILRLSRVF